MVLVHAPTVTLGVPKRCQSDAYIVSTNPHPWPKGTGRSNDSLLSFERLPAASHPRRSQKTICPTFTFKVKDKRRTLFAHSYHIFVGYLIHLHFGRKYSYKYKKSASQDRHRYASLFGVRQIFVKTLRELIRIEKGSGDPAPRFLGFSSISISISWAPPEQSPSLT